MAKLFTYGILKKSKGGISLMKHLAPGSKYIKEDSITATLYTVGYDPASISFIKLGGGKVKGSLYKVPDNQFREIDYLESAYNRVTTITCSGIKAFVYEGIYRGIFPHPTGNW